jgi:hypothetical protein
VRSDDSLCYADFQVTTWSGFVFRPNISDDPASPADQRSPSHNFKINNIHIPTTVSQRFGNSMRNSARSCGIS